MKRKRGLSLGRTGLCALGVTVALAIWPLIAARSANFLGKDVSSLVAGIVSFYPWIAVAEAARVLGVAFALTFVAFALSGRAAATAKRRRIRWLLCPVLPLAAYGVWWLGAALKYPALFQGALPNAMQHGIFHLAFIAKPSWFFIVAAVLALVPVAVLPFSVKRRRKSRVALVAGVAAAAAILLFLRQTASAAHDAHQGINVLLLGVDSLRVDRVTDPKVTPSLHELLQDPSTVTFADQVVGIPRTFPSWVEMLQGKYAAKTGIRHMFPGFGERDHVFKGLATSLKADGYGTSAISDFAGDIFPRFRAGFDEVQAPKLTLMTMIRMSVDQSLSAFLPFMVTGPLRPLFPALKESPEFGDPAHLVDALISDIGRTDQAKPWFKTVFFSTAHFPYAAPHPYYTRFADPHYTGQFLFEKNPDLDPGSAPDNAEVRQVRALYNGGVSAIDAEFGRLFAWLKRDGLWDSTLIIVTADHGEDLYEDGRSQGHGEHLRGENVLHVPFVMKLPADLKPAVHRIPFTTRSIDLATTILDAAGHAAPVGDGVDIMPWVRGERTDAPGLTVYAETGLWFARGGHAFYQKKRLDYPGIAGVLNFDQGYSGEIVINPLYDKLVVAAKHRMMIDGDYKLIYLPTATGVDYELYNRRTDPANLHDLAAIDPGRVAAMKTKLLAFIGREEKPHGQLLDGYVVPQ